MPKKILLADDSITIQKVVELTFSDGDYEVTAVNNGAKAVQKLAEMRPDIILSDIIMPEKNGYEVCEYVKSHPEFRNIPVVLLTGTFEPFDPDRAEKAGCDAVVTKPFESQSLIHKVEELIAQAQAGSASAAAPAAAPPAEPPSPWMEETVNTRENSTSFTTASGGFPAVSPPPSFTHDADIFASAPPIEATTEMPFEIPPTPAFSDVPSFETPSFENPAFNASSDTPFDEPASPEFAGETRAFPRMTFEEMQRMAPANERIQPEPEPAPEPSPWDEPAALAGETRAFTKMSFDDFQASAPPVSPEPPDNATRAFQRVSLEEMQRMAAADEAAAQAATPDPVAETPEVSPWDEQEAPGQEAPAFGGETRAIPKLSFDDFQQMASAPEAPPVESPIESSVESSWQQPAFSTEPEPPAFASDTASPFGNDAEAPAFGGETRAFPKLSFEDFQQMAAPSVTDPQPEPQVASPSAWDDVPAADSSASPFDDAAASPFSAEPAAYEEELPATAIWSTAPEPSPETSEALDAPEEVPLGLTDQAQPEDMPFAAEEETPAAEPAWATAMDTAAPEPAAAEAESEEPPPVPVSLAPEAPPMPISARGAEASAELTEEQVDRIARRVVELISDQVIRNIAWEVIPDMAEMVVKERIRQLEAEA